MSTRRRIVIAALCGAALLLAGCASAAPTPGSLTAEPGGDGPASGQASPEMQLEVEAAWLDGGRLLGIVTSGSSTCVPLASDAAVQADGSLAVTLALPADGDCTRDYVPRVTVLAAPEGVDPAEDLAVVVTDDQGSRGEVDLAGVPDFSVDGPTDYAPSAAWVDDERFVVVTWGSSTCVPAVEDVAASDDRSVTVTFQTPPADQMCMMDMGPRGTFVDATGLGVVHDDATVALTGGADFTTPVTVPITG